MDCPLLSDTSSKIFNKVKMGLLAANFCGFDIMILFLSLVHHGSLTAEMWDFSACCLGAGQASHVLLWLKSSAKCLDGLHLHIDLHLWGSWFQHLIGSFTDLGQIWKRLTQCRKALWRPNATASHRSDFPRSFTSHLFRSEHFGCEYVLHCKHHWS